MRRPIILACVVMLVPACSRTSSSEGADRITCPEAQGTAAPGVLRETPQQIEASRGELGQGSESEISRAVASIHARHPDASSGSIVNYLVTAYCPTVNAGGPSGEDAKRQALRAFATRVRKIVPAGA